MSCDSQGWLCYRDSVRNLRGPFPSFFLESSGQRPGDGLRCLRIVADGECPEHILTTKTLLVHFEASSGECE